MTRQRDPSTLTEGKSFLCLSHDDDDDDDDDYDDDDDDFDDDYNDDVVWEEVFSRNPWKEITD